MHTSELCYRGLKSSKDIYTRRDVVTVYFDDHDNTLAGGNKFTYNAYSKVANITKV